jgi:acetylornithine/succinyldiaminopimelate/putrescine aminotransferase
VNFGPDEKRFVYLNDVAAFDAAMNEDVCAVMIEPIQGEVNTETKNGKFM